MGQPGELFTINVSLSLLPLTPLYRASHANWSWHAGIWGGTALVEPGQACFKLLVSAVIPSKLSRYSDQQIGLIVSDWPREYTQGGFNKMMDNHNFPKSSSCIFSLYRQVKIYFGTNLTEIFLRHISRVTSRSTKKLHAASTFTIVIPVESSVEFEYGKMG